MASNYLQIITDQNETGNFLASLRADDKKSDLSLNKVRYFFHEQIHVHTLCIYINMFKLCLMTDEFVGRITYCTIS